MSTIDTVLLALGAGDPAKGGRLAAFAFLITAAPTMAVVAILLALGPGR